MPWHSVRVVRRRISQYDPEHYRIDLELVRVAEIGAKVVFGFLAARDGYVNLTLDAGWTDEAKAEGGFNNLAATMSILSGPGETGDPDTFAVTTDRLGNYLLGMGTQMAGIGEGSRIAATGVDTSFGTSCSVSITVPDGGLILAGARAENGAGVTANGHTTLYERISQFGVGDRDWGGVSFGYREVSAAGTYELAWTITNQFNAAVVMAALYVPTAGAVTHVQDTPAERVNSNTATCTFPNPL